MAQVFRLPRIGDSLAEGTIQEWFVSVGDTISTDQHVCDLETTKTVVELPCPYGGVVLYLGAEEGDMVELDDILIVVGEAGEDWSPDMEDSATVTSVQSAKPAVSEHVEVASPPKGPPKALPAARKLAAELGIALETLTGTGPSGLITPRDVEAVADSGGASSSSLLENRQPMSMLRKSIAANLLKSWQEIPHAAMGWQVDMTRFFERRKELVEQTGSKIRPEAILMVALVPLLKKYPGLNARVEGTDIIYYEQVNLGFSVGTKEGLMVAVIQGVEALSVEQISTEIARLTDAALNKRLEPEALTGLTFTINNTGPLGDTHGGTTILPLGTSAMLSMERTRPRAVVDDSGEVVVKPIADLNMTYDHRAVDGSHVARFLSELAETLES